MGGIFDLGRWCGLVVIVAAGAIAMDAARSQTAAQSSSAQPVLSRPQPNPGSTVVDDLVAAPRAVLEVHKRPDWMRSHGARPSHGAHIVRRSRLAHRLAPRRAIDRPDIDRPTLAGVELLAPLPRPGEPPHIEVPVPAYPLEAIASAYLTPVPPIVCHRVPREPDLPDPHLYRERTVACEPDNP